jgi:type IV pilus assembly protein PilO
MARESVFQAAWRLNRSFPLAIAALLLLNGAAFVLLNYFLSPRLDDLERRYIEQQAQLRQGRQAGRTPLETFRQGEADMAQFAAAIPPKAEFPALIGELYSLAESAGLEINQIGYDHKELPEQGLLRYALGFAVRGDYGQVKQFIFSLEQAPRLMAIEDVSLSGGGAPGAEQVALQLRLTTYFRAEGT